MKLFRGCVNWLLVKLGIRKPFRFIEVDYAQLELRVYDKLFRKSSDLIKMGKK